MKSPASLNPTGFPPVVTTPAAKNIDEVIAHDVFRLESIPGFVRGCLPFELPPVIFENLAREGRDVLVFVKRGRPGELIKAFGTGSLQDMRKGINSMVSISGFLAESYQPAGLPGVPGLKLSLP